MMNTILNLGLNDEAVEGLANATGNERFAYDAYRRLINMFGDVVWASTTSTSSTRSTRSRSKYKAKLDTDVPAEGLIGAVRRLQEGLPEARRQAVPAGPAQAARAGDRGGVQELDAADEAVTYRAGREHPRPARHGRERASRWSSATWATTRGTGVAFTRDPVHRREQVLRRVPRSTPRAKTSSPASARRCPSTEMPKWNKAVYKQLLEIKDMLEKHYKDVQDIEFTIEKRHAVHAADPQRQADRHRRREDRLRHGEGEADRREDGRPAHPGRRPHPAACCRSFNPQASSREEGRPAADDRPARLARRRGRQARVHRRRSGRAHARRREDPPRPQGDEPRGHRRHARRPPASSPAPAA